MGEKEIRDYLGKLFSDYQYYRDLSLMLTGGTMQSDILMQKDSDIVYKVFNAGYELAKKSNIELEKK